MLVDVSYYDNIGFCMSCIKEEVLNEACIDLIDSFSIISSSDVFNVSLLARLKTMYHIFRADYLQCMTLVTCALMVL